MGKGKKKYLRTNALYAKGKVTNFLSHKSHKHLANVFEMGELKEDAVCVKFTHTASDGKT